MLIIAKPDGWTIIQRRVDASVSLFRPWNDYINGFGDLDGNLWLGLENVHQLTTEQSMRLELNIEEYNDDTMTMNYLQFVVYLFLLWMKTMHYPNTIRSHSVTVVPMSSFTPKSTSKLRSALHIRYSKVIPCFISRAHTAQI